MPSLISQQWQERTSGFFSSSGMKLREAGQSAGSYVGEVAKDAKVNVADVAERVGRCSKAGGKFFSSLQLDMPCKNTS